MAANVDLPGGVTQEAGEESPTTPPTPDATEVSSAPESEEQLSPTDETAQEEQVTLSTPSPGEQVQIAVVPGLKIYADFDLQSQELTATDADLIIEFDNGAVITLTDFALYAAGDTPPMMVLSDGSLISGDTLVFSYTGTEIEPAAGPTLTSGGSGEYRDDLGDLIGGLDRLGGQDPDPFGGGIVAPVEDEEFNLAPDAVDDVVATDEDTPITIPVLANDSDPDGDSLTIIGNTDPANGSLTRNPDGTFTYTPDPNFNGSDSFTYTVSDGNGNFDTATVTIDVGLINDQPDAVDDAYDTPEDAALSIVIPGVLANDTDLDGDALTVIDNTDPANGTVELNANGSFIYTPNDNFNGTDSFTYTVSDGNGGTDTATVNINVIPVNDPPDAVNDAYQTQEDTPLSIVIPGVLANDTDVDGDALTVTGNTDPTSGSLTLNSDGSFTYTPNEDFVGSDSFTYTISDGNGGTDTATVNLTVASVNDLPTATDFTGSVNTAFLVATKTVNNSPFDSAVLEEGEPNAYTEEFIMPFKVTDMAYNNEGKLFGARNDGAIFLMNPLADGPPTVDEDGTVAGLQDLEFQFYLPSETGTNINGIAFDDSSGTDLLYVLNGSTLYVVDPNLIVDGTATLIGSVDGVDVGINNPIDLVAFVGGELYAISKSGSEGEVYRIDIDTATGLPDTSTYLGNVDLSSLTNPYGMVAGFNEDPITHEMESVIYVVGSTGSSGSVLFFDPADLIIDTTLAPDTAFTVNDEGGGTFEALAGEVNPLNMFEGNVSDFLAGDTDPDSDPAGFTVTQINGTDLPGLGESLVFDGRFGSLTVDENGDYTYELTDIAPADGVPDNNTPGYEIFTYTMDDGDGGTDTANIIFSVNNNFSGQLLRGSDDIALETLTGDFGNDLLIGGLGDDTLTGNGGIDTFLFAGGEGSDTVTDFSIAEGDILRLTDVLDTDVSGTIDGLDVAVAVDGENVTLEVTGSEGNTTITLEGINIGGQFDGATTLADLTGLQVDFNDEGSIL